MPAHDLAESIRTIFLQPGPHVSLKDARRLFAGYNRQIEELIAEKEIQTSTRRGAASLTRADMAALALAVWPLEVIEQALGEDAARALPPALRSRAVALNLPEYQAAMLDYLAGDRGTTAGDLVSRQLHDLETEYLDMLLASVPGFAEAMNWLQQAAEPGERF
jgi:hypothetical protein